MPNPAIPEGTTGVVPFNGPQTQGDYLTYPFNQTITWVIEFEASPPIVLATSSMPNGWNVTAISATQCSVTVPSPSGVFFSPTTVFVTASSDNGVLPGHPGRLTSFFAGEGFFTVPHGSSGSSGSLSSSSVSSSLSSSSLSSSSSGSSISSSSSASSGSGGSSGSGNPCGYEIFLTGRYAASCVPIIGLEWFEVVTGSCMGDTDYAVFRALVPGGAFTSIATVHVGVGPLLIYTDSDPGLPFNSPIYYYVQGVQSHTISNVVGITIPCAPVTSSSSASGCGCCDWVPVSEPACNPWSPTTEPECAAWAPVAEPACGVWTPVNGCVCPPSSSSSSGPVNRGPLYLDGGYGALDPTVIQWNDVVNGSYTDLMFTTPVPLGGNTNYVIDYTGNGRTLTGLNFANPRRVTVTGVDAVAATGSENCEFQTLGTAIGTWKTAVVISAASTQPLDITPSYGFALINAFFDGFTIGDGGQSSVIKEYPFGSNPHGYTESNGPHVYICTQTATVSPSPVLTLYVDGVQVLQGTPPNLPVSGHYGVGSFIWNGSGAAAGDVGFARTLYEDAFLSRIITADEVASFTAWFRARAGF